jgi:hypothetical protein
MNKELCTQAYNDVVEFTARLASYSTSSFPDTIGVGHYEFRAKELANRDIIFLCISIRRLVELTKAYSLLKGKQVPCFVAHRQNGSLILEDSEDFFDAWEIVGNIIHAKEIHAIKDDADFHLKFSKENRDLEYLFNLHRNRKSINGVFYIESDRGDVKYFQIHKFIKMIVEFTSDIDELLAENKIFVGYIFE